MIYMTAASALSVSSIYTCVICVSISCIVSNAVADSKRVYIFDLPQTHWDVQPGESLSGITAALLPERPEQQSALMQAIVQLNPPAFINNDPNRLRAGARLILPQANYQWLPHSINDGEIEEYSWGNIRRVPQ